MTLMTNLGNMKPEDCSNMTCYKCPIGIRERCKLWGFYTNELLRTENIMNIYRKSVPEVPPEMREGLLLIIANVERIYNAAQELAMYSLPRALLLLSYACLLLISPNNKVIVDVWAVAFSEMTKIILSKEKGGSETKH